MTLADRIVVLCAGRVIQCDTPDGNYHRPAAKFVAGFELAVPQRRIAACATHAGRELVFGLRPERPLISAALVIAIVPISILIALFQERVVGGLTAGGVKGQAVR